MPLGAIVANFLNSYTEPTAPTFWEVNPAGYSVNPAAYDPIEGPEDSPWD